MTYWKLVETHRENPKNWTQHTHPKHDGKTTWSNFFWRCTTQDEIKIVLNTLIPYILNSIHINESKNTKFWNMINLIIIYLKNTSISFTLCPCWWWNMINKSYIKKYQNVGVWQTFLVHLTNFGFDSGMPRMTCEEKKLHFYKSCHKNVMVPCRIEENLCTKMCLPITLQKL
jgi:hypothetical protein